MVAQTLLCSPVFPWVDLPGLHPLELILQVLNRTIIIWHLFLIFSPREKQWFAGGKCMNPWSYAREKRVCFYASAAPAICPQPSRGMDEMPLPSHESVPAQNQFQVFGCCSITCYRYHAVTQLLALIELGKITKEKHFFLKTLTSCDHSIEIPGFCIIMLQCSLNVKVLYQRYTMKL